MNNKAKLPLKTRKALAELYVKVGWKGVTPAAEAHGVTPKYVAEVAARMGLQRDQHRGRKSKNDPRWAIAIARGKIEV